MTNDLDALAAKAVMENGLRFVRDASAYTAGASDADMQEAAHDIARAVLAAVVPDIRRAVADEIALAIAAEAEGPRNGSSWYYGMHRASHIAQEIGDSDAAN